MRAPAHFFDLGGTLLALDDHDEIAYDEHGRVTILPGVRERLADLAATPVFVVTNQAGIAEGTLTAERFHDFCAQLSAGTGDAVTAYTACTHPRDAGCACRKPKPGLVLSLAETHRLDLAGSVMVGDTDVDRRLAVRAAIGRFIWAGDYFRTDELLLSLRQEATHYAHRRDLRSPREPSGSGCGACRHPRPHG